MPGEGSTCQVSNSLAAWPAPCHTLENFHTAPWLFCICYCLSPQCYCLCCLSPQCYCPCCLSPQCYCPCLNCYCHCLVCIAHLTPAHATACHCTAPACAHHCTACTTACTRYCLLQVFYVAIEYLTHIKHLILLSVGCKCDNHAGLSYYTYGLGDTKPGSRGGTITSGSSMTTAVASEPPIEAPVLFMHGVGAGLVPYLPFVLRIIASGQPMVAVEFVRLGVRVCLYCLLYCCGHCLPVILLLLLSAPTTW